MILEIRLASNVLEYIFFRLFVLLAKAFSFESYKYPAKVLSWIIFNFIPIRKKVVLSNLRKAFPSLTESELNEIAKKNYFHFATLLFEVLGMSSLKRENISRHMKFTDLSEMKKLREEGRAFFLLTAHFGNWELGAVSCGIQLQDEIHVLAKQQRNHLVSNWLDKNREHFGNKVILLGPSVRDIYKSIKENGIVGVVGDQRGSEEGPRTLFMGQETAVYTGTASIAVKTSTPVFVVICVKQKDSSYLGFVEQIDVNNLEGSGQEKVKLITQKYMTILEKHVRNNPEQWFWMHNIWKY